MCVFVCMNVLGCVHMCMGMHMWGGMYIVCGGMCICGGYVPVGRGVCVRVCWYVQVPPEGCRRVSEPLEPELQAVASPSGWVLETELRCSAGATRALNCWAVSPELRVFSDLGQPPSWSTRSPFLTSSQGWGGSQGSLSIYCSLLIVHITEYKGSWEP